MSSFNGNSTPKPQNGQPDDIVLSDVVVPASDLVSELDKIKKDPHKSLYAIYQEQSSDSFINYRILILTAVWDVKRDDDPQIEVVKFDDQNT